MISHTRARLRACMMRYLLPDTWGKKKIHQMRLMTSDASLPDDADKCEAAPLAARCSADLTRVLKPFGAQAYPFNKALLGDFGTFRGILMTRVVVWPFFCTLTMIPNSSASYTQLFQVMSFVEIVGISVGRFVSLVWVQWGFRTKMNVKNTYTWLISFQPLKVDGVRRWSVWEWLLRAARVTFSVQC